MLAGLLLDLWYRSLIGLTVAYGLQLAGLVAFGAFVLRREAQANPDPMTDVLSILGADDPRPVQVGRHHVLPRQRLAGAR